MTEHSGARELYADLRWRHAAVPVAIVFVAAAVLAGIAGPAAVWERWAAALLVSVFILAAAAPVALLALSRHSWRGSAALAIVSGMFIVNLLSLTLPRVGPFEGLDWNWQGKTLDLLWCLALIVLLSPGQRREIGWTWKTNPGTLLAAFINIGIMAIVGFIVLGSGGDFTSSGASGELTLEKVLFDTTHPNLVEEIVLRGFMLAVLDRAFPPRWTLWKAQVGWGLVLTTLLFGLMHGFSAGPEGGVVFDPLWLVTSAVAGLIMGWIRALTGSLWPAYLAHCAPEVGILFALWLR